MSEYKLFDLGVVRIADGLFIPSSEGNKDWNDYLVWVEQGGKPVVVDDTDGVLIGNESQESAEQLGLVSVVQ